MNKIGICSNNTCKKNRRFFVIRKFTPGTQHSETVVPLKIQSTKSLGCKTLITSPAEAVKPPSDYQLELLSSIQQQIRRQMNAIYTNRAVQVETVLSLHLISSDQIGVVAFI